VASPLPVSPSLEIAVAEELAAAAEVEEADAAYLEIMVGEDDDDRHLRQLQRAYVADLQANAADAAAAAAAAAEIYSPGERSFRDAPVKFLLSLMRLGMPPKNEAYPSNVIKGWHHSYDKEPHYW